MIDGMLLPRRGAILERVGQVLLDASAILQCKPPEDKEEAMILRTHLARAPCWPTP
jgi:hypothetical protein